MAVTNIRNPNTYQASFWDWTFLNECFAPTKIRVSDIDGIVERHGRFLWIETKAPGEIVETGQEIMHDAALATGKFSVLLIWGEPNDPIAYCLRVRQRDQEGLGGKAAILGVVRRWFAWADKQPVPRRAHD
jgi:hypothetical protein